MQQIYTLFIAILISQFSYAQPANDLCAGAEAITPDGGCVTGTTIAANDNWNGNIGCQGGVGNPLHPEVWFIFTATNTQLDYTVTTSNGWTGDVQMILGLAANQADPCADGFFY